MRSRFCWCGLLLSLVVGTGCEESQSGSELTPKCPVPEVLWDEGADLWNDLSVLSVGRLAPRASFRVLSQDGFDATGERVVSLDGDWQFKWAPRPNERPVGFEALDFDVSDWGTLPVPANVELYGHGYPIYVNVPYPFAPDVHYNYTPLPDDNPVSAYRRSFDLPAGWANRHVFLKFNGVDSAFYVWVNGQKVGYSEGSRTPAEFDVTDKVRPGVNLVAVEVYRFSDGSYLEDQDMWNMSGIFRSVELYVTEDLRLRDFEVRTLLDETLTGADVEVDLWVQNQSQVPRQVRVDVAMSDPAGQVVFESLGVVKEVAPCSEVALEVRQAVQQPLLWSAETPALYPMTLSVREGTGPVLEKTVHQVGFRKVEIAGGQLLVNNRPVILRGVNRHEHHPERGHVPDRAAMVADIKLLKQNNFNAVRTSHYPFATEWYSLCDQYGIYLVDETNLETHALMRNPLAAVGDKPLWREAHLERLQRMVERDKNHACVILWSLGNEAGIGSNFTAMSDWVKQRDPTRPVQYEPVNTKPSTDVVCPMYLSAQRVARLANQVTDRPVILVEYAHAMGNSTGSFEAYWDVFRSHPRAQGGFIWDWIDQTLYKPVPGALNQQFLAYGGDFEPEGFPTDGNFCANGLISGDRTHHPALPVVKHIQQFIQVEALDLGQGKVRITNEYDFTQLDELVRGFWSLLADDQILHSDEITPLDLAPGEARDFTLTWPSKTSAPGVEYRLHFRFVLNQDTSWANEGHELAWAQLALPDFVLPPRLSGSDAPAIVVSEEETELSLVSSAVTVRVNRNTGALVTIEAGGHNLLAAPLLPDFWRAPTDNDLGNGLMNKAKIWREVGPRLTAKSLRYSQPEPGRVDIAVKGVLPGIDADYNLTYIVLGTGDVILRVEYQAHENLPELPRFGLQLGVPLTFDQLKWYGPGPEETYSDRKQLPIGVYSGSASQQGFDYVRPQESGNKVDVRWAALTDSHGRGLLIVGDPVLSFCALPYSATDLQSAAHRYELPRSQQLFVNIDLAQRGVGGDNSWGALPHPEHRLRAKNYEYRFRLRPMVAGDDPMVLSKVGF